MGSRRAEQSFHIRESGASPDAEASSQVVCFHSAVPDCLESLPLSPSHPREKHVMTATDAGNQTSALGRRLAKTHNPTDDKQRLCQNHEVTIICIGLPVISHLLIIRRQNDAVAGRIHSARSRIVRFKSRDVLKEKSIYVLNKSAASFSLASF